MEWKQMLNSYFKVENWQEAVEMMQKVINENPEDVEGYIQMIYLLHHILVEARYEDHSKDHDDNATLLKKYYQLAENNFSDNPEYLFFIGAILYVAEWYFGIEDGFKDIPDMKAFRMQKRASCICPDNLLFQWSWQFSLGKSTSYKLAEKILHDEVQIKWLKNKSIAGMYILDCLREQVGVA